MSKTELTKQLIAAVKKGDVALAQDLLHEGADPTATVTSTSSSILMIATTLEKTDMLRLILSFNSEKINECDDDGLSALHHAVVYENWQAIDMLLAALANINTRGGDRLQPPPMHTAIYADERDNNGLRRTKYMLERGASPLAQNKGLRTAYDIAQEETRDVLRHHVDRKRAENKKDLEDAATRIPSGIRITKIKPRKPGP